MSAFMRIAPRTAAVCLLALAVAACSQGPGGQTEPQAAPGTPNVAPVANAGADQAVNETASVTLDGSASTDSDGTIAQYQWAQTAGPNVALTDANSARPTFTAPSLTTAKKLTFRLTVTDDRGGTATDDVDVTVNPVNAAPVAADDAASTGEDTPLTISVLANDNDADDGAEAGDPPQIDPASVQVSNAVGGAAMAKSDGTIDFTPAQNFDGAASFQYTVADLSGARSNAATVRINVVPVNDPPAISDIPDTPTDEDTATGPIPFTVSDVDSSSLTVSASSGDTALVPASGLALGGSGGNRTLNVTPAANKNGLVTIIVTVSDGAASRSDSFVLTVQPVNDAPVAHAASTASDEDAPVMGTLSADDVDGDALTFSASGAASNGSVSITSATGAYTFTPAADYHGPASFGFKACDGSNACSSATVSITVNSVNDAPKANNGSATTDEDTPVSGSLSASDVEGDPISYAASGTPVGGTVSITAMGHYTFTPAANFNGSARFDFKACDNSNACGTGTVAVTVTPVNDAPVANAGSASSNEDTQVTGTLSASDVDGDALSFSKNGMETGGTVTSLNASTGAYTFTPAANFNGAASFGFKACDPSLACSTATVSVTVNAVNDAPTISDIPDQSTSEDTAKGPIAFTVGDVDNAANTLTVTATSNNPALIPNSGIALSGTGTDRSLSLTPAANQSGSATITVTVSDGSASTASDTFVFTVTAVNDAPTISDITDKTTSEDTSTGAIHFTVGDVESDPAALTVTVHAADKTLVPDSAITLGGNGADRTITILPAANRNGSTPIVVTVSDGPASTGDSFVLNVTAVNDAPTISNIGDQTIAEDGSTGSIAFTVGDVETAAASLTVSASSDNAALLASGSIVFGGSGANRTIKLTPAANQNGAATVTVTVSDGAASSSKTFLFTVIAVNDAPVADDASFIFNEDTTLNGALSGSDVEHSALTFSVVTPPAHGQLTLISASTGDFSYQPNLNFNGSDSFKFKVNDGSANSAAATVRLTVTDVAEPTLSVNSVSVNEGDAGVTLRFSVSLSRTPDGPVTVTYTTRDGSARAGQDYGAASGTLEFSPGGAITQTVSVPVSDDGFDENDETLQLDLSVSAGSGSITNSTATGIGTILDNDISNLLQVGAAKRSVSPTQAQIDGIDESRMFGAATHKQKFNLGGFGVNPLQNFPDPVGSGGENLTRPAECRVFGSNDPSLPEACRHAGSHGEEDIYVRAFVLQQTGGDTIAFVTLDAVGAGNVIQNNLTQAVIAAAQTAGVSIKPENVVFGQTHSHAGPDLQGLWGGVPADWIANILYKQAAMAVVDALANRRPAHLRMRQGSTLEFNNYRRPRVNPHEDADGHITLLTATGDDGTPVGSILQYNAHPTSIGAGDRPRTPHADFILGALDWIENSATGPGGVALYYNGPIADASGSGSRAGCSAGSDGVHGGVRCRGEGIASAAESFAERELAPTLTAKSVEVTLPVTNPLFLAVGLAGSFNRYYDFLQLPADQIPGIGPAVAAGMVHLPQLTPIAKTWVSRYTLGGDTTGLEVVTIPGEATNTYGEYIRGLARTNVMFLGLTHNSFGYIIPEEEFSYIDPSGDAGFTLPFTGYEEFVSLGPLTAPLLRTQGYNVLFDQAPQQNIPPEIAACRDPLSRACVINRIGWNLDYIQRSYAQRCRDANGPAQICAMIDPATPLRAICDQAGLPEGVCAIFGDDPNAPPTDADLFLPALDTQLRGCDPLDTSNCLYPFPNDWFTVPAAPGSLQSAAKGGTGRRVNFSIAATPRNSAGKPVDPTEWNRNDGFSPGALIAIYVPGLSLEKTYALPSDQIGIANIGLSQDPNSPVLVLEVPDNSIELPAKHLVWSEMDANANVVAPAALAEVGRLDPVPDVNRPPQAAGKAALLIRPAKNFTEGKRYVVVLRNLKDAAGQPLQAQAVFRACRDNILSVLPPMVSRCAELNDKVFPVLAAAGINPNDPSVYLAWDFTVASTENQIGRLRHMRDDAFKSLSTSPAVDDCTQYHEGAPCTAPVFTVDKITENPQGGIARRIEGVITVPSYVVPADPAPLEDPLIQKAISAFCASLPEGAGSALRDGCDSLNVDGYGLVAGLSAPPNRLFYSPADGSPAPDPSNVTDPLATRYGDGLPDRTGSMTTRYICQIPAQASPDHPARPGIYGHGLLDRGVAITYDGVPDLSKEFNFMFCAVDFFGFATGDIVNVVSFLADVSNFPVVPDASQQGFVNFMFLARLLRDPHGFASHPAFQGAGQRPVFDTSEVFYDGNSQGGILGGVVIAADKDIHRGVLGSMGMNYSTLLTRSKDFDGFATPLYLSYTDPLDRQLLFSMIQMLWDRSENDGYAAHLTDNSAFGGTPKAVKLDPNFGDQQVSMWTGDVMARTMGIPVDHQQTQRVAAIRGDAPRHPDLVPYYGMTPLDYGSKPQREAGAEIVWDRADVSIPPITNTPPRTGPDPHDMSAKTDSGRCQKAHFFGAHQLIDIMGVKFDGAPCPALDSPPPTVFVGSVAAHDTGGLTGALLRLAGGLGDAITLLLGGDVNGAIAQLQVAAGTFAGDVGDLILGDQGSVLAALEHLIANLSGASSPDDVTATVADLAGDIQTVVSAAQSGPTPSQGLFLVGTGTANHNPVAPVCVGGGATNCGRRVDPTHPGVIRDNLISRASAITGANGETFILVTTTNIGYFLAYKAEQSGFNGIYDVRLRIAQATGVPSTNITVVSDHSHSAPDTIGIWGGVSAEYMKITADAVVKAAVQAFESRRTATIKVAAVNQNDNPVSGVPRLDSSYDVPPGLDPAHGNPTNEFRMLVADDATTGDRILTLINYAPHATVTNGDKPYRLTGDWAAWAPQEAETLYGGMGLATVGALGSTDWNKNGDIKQKEAEARSRLRTLMAAASAQLQPVQGAGVKVESTFIHEPLTQPVLLLNYKPGVDHNNQDVPSNGLDVRIDRSVLPPFLTGNVVGTYVSAIRIGDVFISTFPGEPFGELEYAIHKEGRVQGASVQFLLGAANDFFGYMVKKSETYEQAARSGTLFLAGCPDHDLEDQAGVPHDDACSDHWTLMVSPTIGSHIVCTLQNSADRLGFFTANRDTECPVLTALDGLGAPPESDSPLAGASLVARQDAVEQARELADQCRETAAPAPLCDAIQEGAHNAEVYLGTGDTAPDAEGLWLRGDLHVHDDHSADGSLPRQTLGQGSAGNTSVGSQIRWAETVGMDFLPLTDHRTFDQHYDPQWRSDKLVLLTGEEANSDPHAIVLGAMDMINQADNPTTPGTPEFRTLQQSIWDAQLQGAAWSTAHPDEGETLDAEGTPNNFGYTTGPNLVEIWNRGTPNRPKIKYCENRWNAGYRFGVAGASDNHFVELWPVAGPGEPITHVFAREKTSQALIEALRAGRTVISLNAAAPFTTLTGDFNGDGVFETVGGDEVQLAPGAHAKLRVTVKNGIGATVRVYRMPGLSVGAFKTFQPTLPDQSFDFDITAEINKPQDWYRVEVRGPGDPDAVDYKKILKNPPRPRSLP